LGSKSKVKSKPNCEETPEGIEAGQRRVILNP